MKDLIYYPTFEPQSLNWLKYALIYIDRFSPIIPIAGKKDLSDVFNLVESETDLIRIVEPEGYHGDRATPKAIEKIESIRKDPKLFSNIFKKENIIQTWSDPGNWNEKLYQKKYNDHFEHFCETQGFGIRNDDGLFLSESLASFYMTFLVDEISFDKQASPITDIPELDELSTSLRIKSVQDDNVINAAKIIINYNLPDNIEKVDLERIIQFRNDSGISEQRKSFNKTVEDFYASVELNFDPFTYLEKINELNRGLRNEIIKFFGNAIPLVLICTLLTNASASLEIIAKMLQGGATLYNLKAVGKEWKLGKDRRSARKFLSKVRRISK